MHKKYKTVTTEFYRLKVTDQTTGRFVVQDLTTGAETEEYTGRLQKGSHNAAYDTFVDTLEFNEEMFNNLCKMELE